MHAQADFKSGGVVLQHPACAPSLRTGMDIIERVIGRVIILSNFDSDKTVRRGITGLAINTFLGC